MLPKAVLYETYGLATSQSQRGFSQRTPCGTPRIECPASHIHAGSLAADPAETEFKMCPNCRIHETVPGSTWKLKCN